MIDSFPVGLACTAFLIFIGHWYRWPKGDLRRGYAYLYGVGAIITGQLIWLVPIPVLQRYGWALWVQVAAFAVVGGAATGFAYFVDWVQRMWLQVTRGISDGGRPNNEN